MTWTYRHKKQLIIIGSFSMLSVIILCFFLFQKPMKKKKPQTEVILAGKKMETKEENKEEKGEITYYQVDIKGQVNVPGIYSVQAGSRVIDVIRLAGDLTEQADTSVINLSKKVTDEMVIVIYSFDEVNQFTETKALEKQKQEKCLQPTEDAVYNDGCIDSDKTLNTSSKISINQASKEQLMSLSGIGEAKATAIIAYREEHGEFREIEQLKDVDGIGEELFASIKENITL